MPTPRQERLAEAIIENASLKVPLGKVELGEKAGYAPATVRSKPGEIIAQEGVQEALAARGFTVENAKRVVAQLLLDEDQEGNVRLKASDMVFKVHGAYAPEKSVNLNMELHAPADPRAQALAEKYEAELRAQME